jgi:hypothetical protein
VCFDWFKYSPAPIVQEGAMDTVLQPLMGDDVSSFPGKYYLEWQTTFIEHQESSLITYHTSLALC